MLRFKKQEVGTPRFVISEIQNLSRKPELKNNVCGIVDDSEN